MSLDNVLGYIMRKHHKGAFNELFSITQSYRTICSFFLSASIFTYSGKFWDNQEEVALMELTSQLEINIEVSYTGKFTKYIPIPSE